MNMTIYAGEDIQRYVAVEAGKCGGRGWWGWREREAGRWRAVDNCDLFSKFV